MESKFVQRDNGLKAIPKIPCPAQLLELDLSGNLLSLSATGLSALPLLPASLESIEIAENQMPTLPSSLRSCLYLTYIDISHNQISNLTPLARMKDLKTLLASDNRIVLLTGLENLTKLTTVSLDNNRVKDTEQICKLSESVQFLSLRNTPVLRFVSAVLPKHFIACQDGVLFGPNYRQEGKSVDTSRTQTVSIGCIDLRKLQAADVTRARAETPDSFCMRMQAHPVVLQDVIEEFNLLKAENAALEAKVTQLENQLSGRDTDSSQFLLLELVTDLDLDVNEFSFSTNKRGQLLALLQERERERLQLKQQLAELQQASVATSPSEDLYISDLESHLKEAADRIHSLTAENSALLEKVNRQSTKLQKFADFRERNKELAHSHKMEMARNRDLQEQLSKVYTDYSKLLRAGLCSALEAKCEKEKESVQKPVKDTPKQAESSRKSDPMLLNRLEQRLAKLHSKVQRMTVQPEEYFQKLQICHDVLDAHPLA